MSLKSELQGVDLKPPKRETLAEVEGIPFLGATVQNWDSLQSIEARPDDLLICTYPKAGTTWMQEIVDMIQHGGDTQQCARAPIYHRIPFIDMFSLTHFISGLEKAKAMPSPRTLKSHLPVQFLPRSFWEQNCKIIYMARNPKDTVVSYFHFHRMNKTMPEPGLWDEFLENFLAGKVACGSWFDHVRGWWEAKNCLPILYLFYEDVKEDPAREIQKVAQFLGIRLQETVLDRTVQHTTFESMKANPMANYTTRPTCCLDHSVSPFIRKGTVGDWKEHFTVAQSERLDDIYAREMGGTGLTFRTQL